MRPRIQFTGAFECLLRFIHEIERRRLCTNEHVAVGLQHPIVGFHRRSPQLDDRVLMPSASPEDASEADPGLGTRGIALECLAKESLRLAQFVALIANQIEQISR